MFEFLIIALILFISGVIHGLVGFAFALTALPMLALVKGVKYAVPLLSLFSFTVNLVMLFILREGRIFKIPLRFFLFIALGVLLGVQGFTFFSERILRILLFIAILGYFLWEIAEILRGKEVTYKRDIDPDFFRRPLPLLIGLAVGLLGGLLNTPGPPIVIYLSLLRFDKNLFKASLQLIFAFSSLSAAINHFFVGNMTLSTFKVFIINLPFVLLGLFIGQRFYSKLSTRVYYYLVNLFLLISAMLLLIKPHV